MFFDIFVKYIFEKFILRTNIKVYEIYYMYFEVEIYLLSYKLEVEVNCKLDEVRWK